MNSYCGVAIGGSTVGSVIASSYDDLLFIVRAIHASLMLPACASLMMVRLCQRFTGT